ncbi:MAG TPA: transporter substrate-binding domain-containing protein [Noviherbaspirillum sp.]|nr:transporter substrate-binding domain-containing protein [Noviherbaspirillum sp.]
MFSSIFRFAATGLFLAGLTAIAAGREVTACGHHDYPPWNWVKEGEIVGVCADVARRVFERLGHTVNLSYVGPWKRCQAMIKAGEVDVNICSFRNPERETYSRFVDVPMAINPIGIFVKKGREFPLNDWSDLDGKRSGIVEGVSMGAEFDTFLKTRTRMETVTRPVLNLRKLDSERIDFVPLGLEAGRLQTRLYGFGESIVPLPKPALQGQLHIAISEHAADLHRHIPEIEQHLSRSDYKKELSDLLRHYHELYLSESLKSASQEQP